VHTSHHPTLQHHNNYNRTENHRQWNAVRPPDDGRKDARNMLRINSLRSKSLFAASSWSHLHLLIEDAPSSEHKIRKISVEMKGVVMRPGWRLLSYTGWSLLSYTGWSLLKSFHVRSSLFSIRGHYCLSICWGRNLLFDVARDYV
jgi:hypothetical protein